MRVKISHPNKVSMLIRGAFLSLSNITENFQRQPRECCLPAGTVVACLQNPPYNVLLHMGISSDTDIGMGLIHPRWAPHLNSLDWRECMPFAHCCGG